MAKEILSSQLKLRILVPIAGGGFTYEAKKLVESLGCNFSYYFVFPKGYKEIQILPCSGNIRYLTPPTIIGKSCFLNMLNTIKSFFEAYSLIKEIKPHFILTIGSSMAVPLSFWGKLFGVKIIYIQTLTRIKSFSLTDKIIYFLRLFDRFYVQWPNLTKKYPKIIYKGRLL